LIRAVLDTSILVRAVIKPMGTVGPVLDELVQRRYTALFCAVSLEELRDVLGRPRLRRRFPITDRDVQNLLHLIRRRGEEIEVTGALAVCRDPKDDVFLEMAVAGRADVVVSGDEDLLVLHPFRGIPIVGPKDFLAMLEC
jgi:putative PIN family toxin of toxin-antitoxin system